MRTLTAVVAIAAFVSFALASEETDISDRMAGYWAAYSTKQFRGAVEYIYPADLDSAKVELLPVFLAAGESGDPELNAISDAFFLNVPRDSRSGISGKEVFIGLNHVISAVNPQLFDAVRGSTIEVLEVALGSEDSATVTYRIEFQGTPATDIERFAKHNGEWYVRVKENPRDTAAKFRQAFGL